jgi:hypothetical protein
MFINSFYLLMIASVVYGVGFIINHISKFFGQICCRNENANISRMNILYRNIQNIHTETLTDEDINRIEQVAYISIPQVDSDATIIVNDVMPEIKKSEEFCAICLLEFVDADILHKYNCSHTFHIECSKSWLKIKGSCPICRSFVMTT